MQSGVERIWVRRLLVAVGVGVLAEVVRLLTPTWRSMADLVLVATGGLVALVTVLASPLTSTWTPAPGGYVTLLGGLLVSLGAGVTLLDTRIDGPVRPLRSVGD